MFVGVLSTADPNIVGYVFETITLHCEHHVAKSNLESVVWKKLGVNDELVAEYDKNDDPKVSFFGSMVGRASVMVFPSMLKFSNGSLDDQANYQCEVFPLTGSPGLKRYKLTVNGTDLFISCCITR